MNEFCTKCGTKIVLDSEFCPKCGTKKFSQSPSFQNTTNTPHTRSPFWYLLPIFFGIIGGIIAYVILKDSDQQKAKRSLVLGIILTVPMFAWMTFLEMSGNPNPFYVVASGNMTPALEVYDVIFASGNEPFEEIDIGDIIVFDRPSDHNRVIVSRVVSVIDDNPKTIRTQGDANNASIPGTDFPITEEEYIGKVTYVLPQLGYVTQLLKPPVNYIIIISVLAVLFAVLGLKHNNYKKQNLKE
jgi:signal peptidase I